MQMAAEQVCWVAMEDISGWQKSEEPLYEPPEDLMDSDGGMVLLAVREDGGYTLLAGRKRLLEMRAMGQSCVDAFICSKQDVARRVSELLSGLVRGDMHYLDEAEEYRRLLNSGLITRQELCVRLGRSIATLQRKLRLLELNPATQQILRLHGLCERYAQSLLRIPGDQGRQRLAEHIAQHGLSVREVDELVEETLARMPIPIPKERKMMPLMRDHRLYLNAIRSIVEQMRDAGLDAMMEVVNGTSVVEVRLTVPRFSQKKR